VCLTLLMKKSARESLFERAVVLALKLRRKKISEPPVYEKGSNETTLDPPRKWSVNAFNKELKGEIAEDRWYCPMPIG
jgi:hypothetical protein